jgi:uncharacterized protein (TIGR02145 family)
MEFLWARLSILLVFLFFLSPAGAKEPDPATVTDIDGNTYATVMIGDQVWMAENLRVTRYSDGTSLENFVMDNNEDNALEYGRLYGMEAALRVTSDSSVGQVHVQGASPEGWHIPSDEEWRQLIEHLGGEAEAGGKLKVAGAEHWSAPNAGATNQSGFGALPTGWFDFTGKFKGFKEKSFLRSVGLQGECGGSAWELNSLSSSIVKVFLHPKDAIPIRCIKNK